METLLPTCLLYVAGRRLSCQLFYFLCQRRAPHAQFLRQACGSEIGGMLVLGSEVLQPLEEAVVGIGREDRLPISVK